MSSPIDAQVSVFPGSTITEPCETITVADAVGRVRQGVYRQHVENLRWLLRSRGKDAYARARRRSVGFTPGGY